MERNMTRPEMAPTVIAITVPNWAGVKCAIRRRSGARERCIVISGMGHDCDSDELQAMNKCAAKSARQGRDGEGESEHE